MVSLYEIKTGQRYKKNGTAKNILAGVLFFEASVGQTEGVVGVDTVSATPVDKREEQFSELLFRGEG